VRITETEITGGRYGALHLTAEDPSRPVVMRVDAEGRQVWENLKEARVHEQLVVQTAEGNMTIDAQNMEGGLLLKVVNGRLQVAGVDKVEAKLKDGDKTYILTFETQSGKNKDVHLQLEFNLDGTSVQVGRAHAWTAELKVKNGKGGDKGALPEVETKAVIMGKEADGYVARGLIEFQNGKAILFGAGAQLSSEINFTHGDYEVKAGTFFSLASDGQFVKTAEGGGLFERRGDALVEIHFRGAETLADGSTLIRNEIEVLRRGEAEDAAWATQREGTVLLVTGKDRIAGAAVRLEGADSADFFMGKGAASLVALVAATQERFVGASLSLSLRQEEKGGWTLSGSGITRTGLSLTFGGAADLRADQAAAGVAKLWFFETDGKRIVNTSLSDSIKTALNQKIEVVGVESDLRVVMNGKAITFTGERADGASLKWSGKILSGDRLEAGHWVAWTQNEILSIDGESVDPRLNAMWTGEGARAIADVSLNETKGGLAVSVVGYRGDGARVEMIADVKTLDGFARAVGADGALLGMTFFESGEWSTRMIRETGGAEFQVFVHLKDGTSEHSGRIRDVATSLGDRTLHHYAGWLNKGVSKEARGLTAELFKSLGVGWSGSGGMATIYENGASVGFGLIGKEGNLTAAYLSDAKRFYVMTSGGLRAVGHMTAVNGISVAVIHGKLTNALGVLATAAGAKFISNGGPVNIWKGPNGEIHGALGTRLFIYGKGGFTALRVYENRGRLYVEGSFSRTTFQRVQSDGTVINVNVRQGTYAVMGGKGGISFKNEFSVSYGGVVGKLSDLPAGTVLRVELMGKLVSVTLGAPGSGLVRAIQDVTMAGPGGTKIIVREIGVVGVKASGAAGAGVDPRTITNGALVPTAFATVSSNGKVTAEFKTGADGQIRMVGLDLRTWNVGGETLALWLGGRVQDGDPLGRFAERGRESDDAEFRPAVDVVQVGQHRHGGFDGVDVRQQGRRAGVGRVKRMGAGGVQRLGPVERERDLVAGGVQQREDGAA
jgi:hypothetical protein